MRLHNICRYMDRLYDTQRERVQQISVEHALRVLGGRIGVVFYDVTTLYFGLTMSYVRQASQRTARWQNRR